MAARLGLQIYEWVNRFARKLAAKPGKEGIMTIPNQETVRDLSNEILTKFMKYNVPREALQSENDIKVIYNQIKNIEEQTLARNLKKELTPKKVAPVLDLTGKKIDTSKPILGGKNVPESEAQIKTKLEGMNKKTVERIRRRRYEAALKEERRKMAKDPEYIPKILDPDDFADGGLAPLLGEPTYADGGRIGFKLGGIDKARRAFLKWAGAGAAGIGAAKSGLLGLLKSGKPITGVVTSVPIKSGVDGMPAWFKPLVNKVIKEGTEVPSGAERVIVHKTKLPDSKTDFYVEQDLNTGNVVVDIGVGKHGFSAGYHGQPVRLEYKASEVIEPNPAGSGFITSKGQVTSTGISKGKMTDKGMKTKEEFWVEEAEFTGGHPENIKFEESTFEKFGEHGSDFSEVEKFATGKVTKSSKGKKEVWEADWDDSLPDDYASGGRVPFVKGKLAKYTTPEGIAELIEKMFPGTTKVGQTSRPMAPKTLDRRAIAGFQEREKAAKSKIIDHSGDAPKAGEGRFTKAEAIIMRLENTIKGAKGKKDKESKYVLETFPNFIKEIKAKPELANNQNVWDNIMGELPKDQQFVVYGDDTVDFFTQSKFGPHNIASKEAFHRKHPYLTKQEAIKISTMEPTDQVMELKRLEILRRTKNASGGLAEMLGE